MVRDTLTGVYSRVTLGQRLYEEINRSRRYGLPLTIILLDLDHYKSVNDAFGHLRGDQVLVTFAQRLSSTIRNADLIYRYGGDEFLLVLPNTSKDRAILLGQRLLEAIHAVPFDGEPPINLTVSMGIASFPEDGLNAENLFAKADQRHYFAKRRGRNCLVSDDPIKQPLLLDTEARLVERDESLHVLSRFLSRLADSRRGIFSIYGVEGSGRHRFLGEVGKIARLQGYEVMPLHGSVALKNRAYGDLGEVHKNWETLPSPSEGTEIFLDALVSLVEEKGRSGLLFTIDQLHEVDWLTFELIRSLLLNTALPIRIGLAYSAPIEQSHRLHLPVLSVMEAVEMLPLSKHGVQITLRHMLQWEAPEELIEWLYIQTGGLPGYLQHGVEELVQQGILERYDSGWVISRSYHTLSLRERLNLQVMPPPTNLPGMPTTFIGREQEIQHARQLLLSNRLLTITGPGGIGKTRLSVQVATEIMPQFPQGVYWVPLAGVSADIITAITTSLRFSFYSAEDTESQLCQYLREKQILLVLDNFEHLTSNAGLLARILEAAPQVKLLVTSRQRLALHGESLLELSGFDYPTQSALARIEGYPAVQLFVHSARRVQPDFGLTDANKPDVVSICQLVQGSPLGIELAASWVRLLSCAEIVQEITRNQDFLVTDMQDLPDRHRSLRAVFNHSWNLLTPDEQNALGSLSVFQGGFSRSAAAKVADASITTLISLLDKSLLYKTGEGRYSLHEVLAGFAREKLAETPQRSSATQLAHCKYFTGFLASLEEQLLDTRQVEALDSIEHEVDNLRTAWEYAIHHQLIEEIAQSLHSLYYFYNLRGRAREGSSLFKKAEEAFTQKEAEAHQYLAARLKARRGVFETRLSEYGHAVELFTHSLEVFHKHADQQELAFTLLSYGSSLAQVGSFDLCRKVLNQSLALHIEIDHARGIASTLNELGANEYQQGNYQLAEQFHLESLRIFREIVDHWGLAQTLSDLGNVDAELGNYLKARQYYLESLDLSEKIGARAGVATTLNNIGDIARTNGEYLEAQQYLTRSVEVYSELGDRYGMSVALLNLGDTALRLGQTAQAEQFVQHSLRLCHETNDALGAAYAQTCLANLAFAAREWHKAADLLEQSLQVGAANHASPLLLQSLLAVANLFAYAGKLTWALELVQFIANHPAAFKADRDESQKLITLLKTLVKEPPDGDAHPGRLVQDDCSEQTLVEYICSQGLLKNIAFEETG